MGNNCQMADLPKNSEPIKFNRPRVLADFGGRRKILDRRMNPFGLPPLERRSGAERRSGFDRRGALSQKDEIKALIQRQDEVFSPTAAR